MKFKILIVYIIVFVIFTGMSLLLGIFNITWWVGIIEGGLLLSGLLAYVIFLLIKLKQKPKIEDETKRLKLDEAGCDDLFEKIMLSKDFTDLIQIESKTTERWGEAGRERTPIRVIKAKGYYETAKNPNFRWIFLGNMVEPEGNINILSTTKLEDEIDEDIKNSKRLLAEIPPTEETEEVEITTEPLTGKPITKIRKKRERIVEIEKKEKEAKAEEAEAI